MDKMKKEKKTINETFTAIPDWYWQCGLNLIEVNIIARIASWQRAEKEFYEGYDTISEKFNVHYNTVRKAFIKLEKMEVIKKNGKHRRAWKWVLNPTKLNALKKQESKRKEDSNTECQKEHSNTGCQKDATFLHQVSEILTPDVSYKNTKTSYKTSFREEDNVPSSSSSKPKKTISDLEVLNLAKQIDI